MGLNTKAERANLAGGRRRDCDSNQLHLN